MRVICNRAVRHEPLHGRISSKGLHKSPPRNPRVQPKGAIGPCCCSFLAVVAGKRSEATKQGVVGVGRRPSGSAMEQVRIFTSFVRLGPCLDCCDLRSKTCHTPASQLWARASKHRRKPEAGMEIDPARVRQKRRMYPTHVPVVCWRTAQKLDHELLNH